MASRARGYIKHWEGTRTRHLLQRRHKNVVNRICELIPGLLLLHLLQPGLLEHLAALELIPRLLQVLERLLLPRRVLCPLVDA